MVELRLFGGTRIAAESGYAVSRHGDGLTGDLFGTSVGRGRQAVRRVRRRLFLPIASSC